MDIDHPLPLLGGLSPVQFGRRHWQKRPLLIRQALPALASPIERAALFALAARDDVESRVLERQPAGWRLRHGPFTRRQLPPLAQPGWTLLVQGLDLHVPAAHALLNRFRFMPDARLDDLMISYASDAGGVGPHVDAYDVFLLQVQGVRRWRVGRVSDPAWLPDLPVKILRHFEPSFDALLGPGDMLYLPPGWGHDGIAQGACMTCSIGFRAPGRVELARELLARWAENADTPAAEARFRDPPGSVTSTPGRIPASLADFAADAVARWTADRRQLDCALGEVLTEPKREVWFEPGRALRLEGRVEAADLSAVELDRRTRMMYGDHHVFINGESFEAAGRDARLMQRLADVRRLTLQELGQLSAAARVLLCDWSAAGWIHGLYR
jgi:50S ribosomal protein L16 3-hydroxylase